MYSFNEHVFWNKNSYGKAVRIKKNIIIKIFIFICIITPATNWLIPFSHRIFKNDVILRYDIRRK